MLAAGEQKTRPLFTLWPAEFAVVIRFTIPQRIRL